MQEREQGSAEMAQVQGGLSFRHFAQRVLGKRFVQFAQSIFMQKICIIYIAPNAACPGPGRAGENEYSFWFMNIHCAK